MCNDATCHDATCLAQLNAQGMPAHAMLPASLPPATAPETPRRLLPPLVGLAYFASSALVFLLWWVGVSPARCGKWLQQQGLALMVEMAGLRRSAAMAFLDCRVRCSRQACESVPVAEDMDESMSCRAIIHPPCLTPLPLCRPLPCLPASTVSLLSTCSFSHAIHMLFFTCYPHAIHVLFFTCYPHAIHMLFFTCYPHALFLAPPLFPHPSPSSPPSMMLPTFHSHPPFSYPSFASHPFFSPQPLVPILHVPTMCQCRAIVRQLRHAHRPTSNEIGRPGMDEVIEARGMPSEQGAPRQGLEGFLRTLAEQVEEARREVAAVRGELAEHKGRLAGLQEALTQTDRASQRSWENVPILSTTALRLLSTISHLQHVDLDGQLGK
ncbi:unnamed protein product [Closterium sp. NIES-64]|nr:unnamed protein product [Closterium sp. NIES-64]